MPIWFPGIVHAGDVEANRAPGVFRRFLPPLLVILAVVFALVLALRFEGRMSTCACGELYLWAGDIWSSHNSQHVSDPYTLTHMLHGVILFWFLSASVPLMRVEWRLAAAVGIESLWEVVENSPLIIERYRNATIALGYEGDTIVNSLGDVTICAVGFLLAGVLGSRLSAVLFLATEAVLLLWIRDSLLLNIIMLVYPSESILNWQMG